MCSSDLKTPEVPDETSDEHNVDRSKSRVFTQAQIDRAKTAPARAKDTYQSDKDIAHALRRDGDKESYKQFRKKYSGYRAKRELKSYGSAMGGFAKGIISGMSEDTE